MKRLGFSTSTGLWRLVERATRSALGSLNNRIADAKCLISCKGGLDHCNVRALAHLLNGTPMKPIGYSNGLEQMRRLVDKALAIGQM